MASPRVHGVPHPSPCQNYYDNKKMVNASLLGAQHLAGAHGDLSVCVSPHLTTVPLGESRSLHVLAAPPRAPSFSNVSGNNVIRARLAGRVTGQSCRPTLTVTRRIH